MKVILTANVESLGRAGDIVRVATGYARNFLLPRKLALEATPGNLKVVAQHKRQYAAAESRQREESEVIAQRISEVTVKIHKKVGERDVLYGSVTAAEIAEGLEKAGVKVDKRKLEMESPIKTIGLFEIPIRLHPEVTGLLKVQVEGE